jgi:hypothetical protein
MQFSLDFERQDFMACYRMFRFAFSESGNPLIDEAADLSRNMLLRVFTDKPAYALEHPYPVSIPSLFDVLSPQIGCSVAHENPTLPESMLPDWRAPVCVDATECRPAELQSE